jgi:hypothetical protein
MIELLQRPVKRSRREGETDRDEIWLETLLTDTASTSPVRASPGIDMFLSGSYSRDTILIQTKFTPDLVYKGHATDEQQFRIVCIFRADEVHDQLLYRTGTAQYFVPSGWLPATWAQGGPSGVVPFRHAFPCAFKVGATDHPRMRGTALTSSGGVSRTALTSFGQSLLAAWLKGTCSGDFKVPDGIQSLFRRLIRAKGQEKERIYQQLLLTATPADILSLALRDYEERGNDDRLTLAASLLGGMGRSAWGVLEELATSGRPECEYFVSTIANLDGVPSDDRMRVLEELAMNPSKDVRLRVLDALGDFPALQGRVVLARLAECGDEEIEEAARDRLLAV